MPKSLLSARAVFLRVDSVRRPLEPPYEGPFEVLSRSPKTFTIRRGDKPVVVSVDRLKPAFPFVSGVDPPLRSLARAAPPGPPSPSSSRPPSRSDPPPQPATAVTTRSGRASRPTVRFNL